AFLAFLLTLRTGGWVSPKYICWVVLGLAGLSLPTGMGTFRKELGSYQRSLLGKNLPPNISVELCWVWRAQAYLRELWKP
ncbi:MAG: hypothetical protein O4806_17825, partial [Trichodesmium sp. St5_bin8]|nr:hypothetical protein [Trichodesmium sp. St5_bin8]